MTAAAAAPSRRERLREATQREIREVARKLLVAEGATAISLRAIAREMGMTAPALYRYYPSHTDLIAALTVDLFDELTGELARVRDELAAETLGDRLEAVCRMLRQWSIGHPAEFGLIFASPVQRLPSNEPYSPAEEAGMRFGMVFFELVLEQWQTRPFPVPDRAELGEEQYEQLVEASAALGGLLPPEAVHVFLNCWIRLYGLVCMDVFGQLGFALRDVGPMFEECLVGLASTLDLPAADHGDHGG